jgi:hypothetical protein
VSVACLFVNLYAASLKILYKILNSVPMGSWNVRNNNNPVAQQFITGPGPSHCEVSRSRGRTPWARDQLATRNVRKLLLNFLCIS